MPPPHHHRPSRVVTTSGPPRAQTLVPLLDIFFRLQLTLKLYHWTTESFARHTGSDRGLDALSQKIDRFVETYIARYGRPHFANERRTLSYEACDDSSIVVALQRARQELESQAFQPDARDLTSIVDEMIEDVDQTLYLFTLS